MIKAEISGTFTVALRFLKMTNATCYQCYRKTMKALYLKPWKLCDRGVNVENFKKIKG